MAVKLVSSTKIYLDARKLLDIILDIVPNFPRAYKFTIGAKLQEIGVNLMQEIAAAYINKDKAETVKHLTEFQAEFETMKTLMRIAGEREWIKGRELEMATTDKEPITLSSDRLDMDLFRLLLTKYVVVTEQRDGKVIYELNSIEHHADN